MRAAETPRRASSFPNRISALWLRSTKMEDGSLSWNCTGEVVPSIGDYCHNTRPMPENPREEVTKDQAAGHAHQDKFCASGDSKACFPAARPTETRGARRRGNPRIQTRDKHNRKRHKLERSKIRDCSDRCRVFAFLIGPASRSIQRGNLGPRPVRPQQKSPAKIMHKARTR